jgi:hypothetical protein
VAEVLCSALASMVWPRSTVRFAGASDDWLVGQSRRSHRVGLCKWGILVMGSRCTSTSERVVRSVWFRARSHTGGEGEMRRRSTAAGMLVAEQQRPRHARGHDRASLHPGCSMTQYFYVHLNMLAAQEHAMRPLRYSINVTLDGCCDHRAIPRTKTCIVTRLTTSTRPMPFCLAG